MKRGPSLTRRDVTEPSLPTFAALKVDPDQLCCEEIREWCSGRVRHDIRYRIPVVSATSGVDDIALCVRAATFGIDRETQMLLRDLPFEFWLDGMTWQ